MDLGPPNDRQWKRPGCTRLALPERPPAFYEYCFRFSETLPLCSTLLLGALLSTGLHFGGNITWSGIRRDLHLNAVYVKFSVHTYWLLLHW
jgi:hypothetical protein